MRKKKDISWLPLIKKYKKYKKFNKGKKDSWEFKLKIECNFCMSLQLCDYTQLSNILFCICKKCFLKITTNRKYNLEKMDINHKIKVESIDIKDSNDRCDKDFDKLYPSKVYKSINDGNIEAIDNFKKGIFNVVSKKIDSVVFHIEYIADKKLIEINTEYEALKIKYSIRELEELTGLLCNYVNMNSNSETWKIIKDKIRINFGFTYRNSS